jgi:acetylornithine deacetylase/succinyl-diaminopimelate desuccinylase-like protein
VTSVQEWTTYFKEREENQLEELFELIRIPSVSAVPAHQPDIERTADWIAERLTKAGIPDVRVLRNDGHPLVVGRWHVSEGQPTALFYAHYDVQPPDPLDEWISPPFEPTIRDGRIYARGSADDKAGLLSTILSVEAMAQKLGSPPINLVFFFEGEEEIGSPSVQPMIAQHKDLLECDYIISADGLMHGADTPSLTVALKGMAALQIDLRTASTDSHSGIYGAAIRNAAQATAELAATFHDVEGRVAVEGFYDRVVDPTPDERQEIANVPFDEQEMIRQVSAQKPWGESGYSVLERIFTRPTLDINGIWSGYEGEGSKTVTPCQGHIKITCRLVPDQDPDQILQLIKEHAQKHCPPGAQVTFGTTAESAHPFAVSRGNRALVTAGEVIKELTGKDPVIVRSGGTIPIAEVFKNELGAELVFFAWSLNECNAHAPNEWYRLEDFQQALVANCVYLERLAH